MRNHQPLSILTFLVGSVVAAGVAPWAPSTPADEVSGERTLWKQPLPEDLSELKRLPMQRFKIYTVQRDGPHYSHHAAICKFRDRYIATWSSGSHGEGSRDMRVDWCWSLDGKRWAPIQTLAKPIDGQPRVNGGFHVGKDQIVAYVGTNSRRVDAYVSRDGLAWEHRGRVFTEGGEFVLFESFRTTNSGTQLAMGVRPGTFAVVVRLKTDDPLGPAEVIDVPWPAGGGPRGRRMEEASWYQTDDGRIWLYNRDGGIWPQGADTSVLRLWLCWSDDDGRSWSVPVVTDIPDSSAEPYAGRLPDGRYFVINNPNRKPMDRTRLALSVSEDGQSFDQMYILVDEPSKNQYNGMEPGYQYPHGLVEDDRLMVIYSVNKEDVEVGIIPLPLP